ncbi:transcriptional regulator (plasmid) [Streptomyces microflavus]|uniref:helix-turn-helix domain-containing protein n=1 Tax=Streptomyces microflavus TaxID=1919 RepID=UPI002E1378F1|nr:transcriptional regulator [Streptomyces microflavus]
MLNAEECTADLPAEIRARHRHIEVARLLKEQRTRLGLTAERAAQRLRITPFTYGSWERGQLLEDWPPSRLSEIAVALEMNTAQFRELRGLAGARGTGTRQPDMCCSPATNEAPFVPHQRGPREAGTQQSSRVMGPSRLPRLYSTDAGALRAGKTEAAALLPARIPVEAADRPRTGEHLVGDVRATRLPLFLREQRDYLKLSQEDVAGRLEISSRAYGNWERGLVKEWTDAKLFDLARALEMSEYQTTLLFRYAVDRAPAPDQRAQLLSLPSKEMNASTFLRDYATMMSALALPSFVIDQRWDIKMTNQAYDDLFHSIGPHPSAMPSANFLRFGFFHPEASTVLVDQPQWKLAMAAQLSSSLERHGEDAGLQSIRRDVYLRPDLLDLYVSEMPAWVLAGGTDLVHHEGALRALRHPDPAIGIQGCRLVEESSRSLQALGLTRLTLVFVDPDRGSPRVRREDRSW